VPPIQALAALHGFWIMVAIATLVVVPGRLTPEQVRHLGLASTAVGVVGLLTFIIWDLTSWLASLPPEFRRYSFQRILFAIGTQTDVPLVQLAVAGTVCWIVGKVRKKRVMAKNAEPVCAIHDAGT
jgi:hypothetical protein